MVSKTSPSKQKSQMDKPTSELSGLRHVVFFTLGVFMSGFLLYLLAPITILRFIGMVLIYSALFPTTAAIGLFLTYHSKFPTEEKEQGEKRRQKDMMGKDA